MVLQCKPTIEECKIIFTPEFQDVYFKKYVELFKMLNKNPIPSLYPGKQFYRLTKTTTEELLNGVNTIAGGMVELAKKKVFNKNTDFYKVEFLEEEGSKLGMTFSVFCYINDRWVFIPKPWN